MYWALAFKVTLCDHVENYNLKSWSENFKVALKGANKVLIFVGRSPRFCNGGYIYFSLFCSWGVYTFTELTFEPENNINDEIAAVSKKLKQHTDTRVIRRVLKDKIYCHPTKFDTHSFSFYNNCHLNGWIWFKNRFDIRKDYSVLCMAGCRIYSMNVH